MMDLKKVSFVRKRGAFWRVVCFLLVLFGVLRGGVINESGLTEISLIEVRSEYRGQEPNPDYKLNSVTDELRSGNTKLEYITFNMSNVEEIKRLKQNLYFENELIKLKQSGKRCFYGLKCLYGLTGEKYLSAEEMEKEYSTELDDDQFERLLGDNNKYRYFTLENGLRVFLLSNDVLYTSSLSLGVNVGNGHDPEYITGLSFLLTEELFRKREDTSGIRDFRTLIDENNGYFNIDTRTYHTIYSYDIKSKLFQDSLQSFIGCLKRDLNDRDSFEASIRDVSEMVSLFSKVDGLKEQQLLRSLSNVNHTFHRFPYGTNETLVQIPLERNISVWDEAVKFKNKYYVPRLMTLSVATNLSIETAEKLVRTYFSSLENHSEEEDDLKKEFVVETDKVNITENEETVENNNSTETDKLHPYYQLVGKFIEIRSKDLDGYVKLEFPIPRQHGLWRAKTGYYVKYFLSQNYKGGMLDYLINRGWVRDVDVSIVNDDSGFSLLVIKIALVQSNKDAFLRTLQTVFAVLNSVRVAKCDDNLYEQIRRVEQGYLRQYRSTGYYRYSKEIITSFFETECDPSEVLKVPYEFEKVRCRAVADLINYINPYNMVILVSSRTFSRNANDFLLSNKVFGESVWSTFCRNFMSIMRMIRRSFLRPGLGEYPKYIKEHYLHGEYFLSDIPERTLELLNGAKNDLLQNYIGFNITEISINFPELYNIYTYDTPPQTHPELLTDSLSSYIKYATKTSELVDETYINKVLSSFNDYLSPLARSTYYYPTNVGIPKLGLSCRIYVQPNSLIVYGFQSFPKTNTRLAALSYLFSRSFKYALDPEFRDGIAEIEFRSVSELQVLFLGIEINWINYANSFDGFFNAVLSGLSSYSSFVTNTHLNQAKSNFESKLNKLSSLSSEMLVEDTSFEILNFYYMTLSMFRQAIKSIKLRDIIDFANYVLSVGTIETLVIGNCTPMQVNSYLIKLGRLLRRDGSVQGGAGNLRYLESRLGFLRSVTEEASVSSPHLNVTSNQTSDRDYHKASAGDMLHVNGTESAALQPVLEESGRRTSETELTEKSSLSDETYKGKWANRISMDNLPSTYRNIFYLRQSSKHNEDTSIVYLEIQVGGYSEEMLAFLKLVTNLNIRSKFKEFTSEKYPNTDILVKQYALKTSYLLFKIIISSSEYNIVVLTSLAIQFYNKYFKMVTPLISREEFKKAVSVTVGKIEVPHTDIEELLKQYTLTILDRRSNLNWKYIQVAYLLNLNYNEFLNNWSVFSNPPILVVSVLKNNASLIEVAEANSFELDGFLRLNSTNLIKKIALESNFVIQ